MRKFAFVLEQTLGHGAHSRNLRRELQRNIDIEPTVVELDFETASRRVRRFPILSNWSLRASAEARRALHARLRRGPLDGLFVHTQTASLLLGRLMKSVPTVISLDATPRNFDAVGEWYGHRTGLPPVEHAKTALYRRTLSAAEELVVWCEWAAQSLVADYGMPRSKIHVIPPGVDLELFKPAVRNGGRTPVRVLFVGGDFARKGGPDLLGAMTALEDVEVDIVTTETRVTVPTGVRCRIHRGLGPQSAELLRLYSSADIFALPSRSDCLPQALAEAAASGLPIVATRVGAIPEIVNDGVNGFLVDPGGRQGLASALRRLAVDPSLRFRFGAASRRMAEESHDASRNNREIFRLMHRSAVRRGRPEATINPAVESA